MLSIVLAAGILATPAQETQTVTQCAAWFEGRAFNSGFEVRSVEDGVCLNGGVAKGDAEGFMAALNGFKPDQPIVLVVRSPGGDADVTLEMAEALLERPVTVIAYDICASSCANYLLAAGTRKIVWNEAILAYHGGASWEHLDDITSQIRLALETAAQPEPVILKNIEDNRQTLGRLIARQDAFLLKAQISPTLFRWMGLYNHMTPAEQQSHCATEPYMLVYPPETLARFGLSMDRYDGPEDQAALDALVAKKGLEMPLCYWRN